MPVTRNCDSCGQPYTRPPSLVGRYCSRECKSRGDKKERTTYRRIRKAPEHPLAPPSGFVSEARVVLYERIGPGEHPCHWCGTSVTWIVGQRGNRAGALMADHLNGDHLDDDPGNLVPSCWSCNADRARRGAKDRAKIEKGEPYRVRADGSRMRGELRHCLFCATEFVGEISPNPRKGRFCSRSCARSWRGMPE